MAQVELTQDVKDQVFAAALDEKYRWRKVCGVERTEVSVGGVDYVVEIQDPTKYLAYISWTSQWGNTDQVVRGSATVAQHHKVVAAMRAHRSARPGGQPRS